MVTSHTYSTKTVKRLLMFSAARCMNPSCSRVLFADLGGHDEPVDKICHIHSEKTNGPRHLPGMTIDDLRDYENLVLLCDDCHTCIDRNPRDYPASLLRSWREGRAEQVLRAQSGQAERLSTIVRALTRIDLEEDPSFARPALVMPYDIQEKIDYNNLELYEFVVRRYSEYDGRLRSLYEVLEEQTVFKKRDLLRTISFLYLRLLGSYKGSNDRTQADVALKHADDIFDDIKNELVERVVRDVGDDVSLDDVEFGVLLVMVDAFMDCKILEPPPHDR